MRNDSILYTGANTNAQERIKRRKEAEEARQQAKKTKRDKIKDSAEIIFAEIDKEKQQTSLALLGTIKSDTPDDEVKSLIAALNMYGESMSRLGTRLSAILREPGAK